MNISQQIITPLTVLLSFLTAGGVLLHDTHMDKAFVSVANKPQAGDMTSDSTATVRSGSNLHPHAEHMSVVKNKTDDGKALPRNRDRKNLVKKRAVRGYHGEGYCMPFAGEWV